MNSHVQTTLSVMRVFLNKQVYHGASYTWMSLGYIQKQLADFHNKKLSIPGIKWQLAKIKRLKFMKFYKNNCGRRPDGTIYRRPSNRSFMVNGLRFLAACGVEVGDWLWDVVTQKIKLARAKGLGYWEKKQLADQEAPDAPNGVRKLISSIGKSFSGLKLFT